MRSSPVAQRAGEVDRRASAETEGALGSFRRKAATMRDVSLMHRRAKNLRRKLSLPEVLLWVRLRRRTPGDPAFRRQHPVGRYVLDFYCAEMDLAIEVDGEVHDRGDRPERDLARDTWLSVRKVRVLRIPASDVLRDLDAVILHIGAH